MSDKCPGCKVEIIHHRVPDCPRCGTALPDPHAEIVSLRAENARLTELVARKQLWWDDVCAATKRAEAAEARVAALQEEVERKRVKLDERFDRIRALENEVETWRKLVKPLQESADRTVDVIVPALEAAEEKVAALEKQLHDTLARKGSDFSGMVRKIAAPTAERELMVGQNQTMRMTIDQARRTVDELTAEVAKLTEMVKKKDRAIVTAQMNECMNVCDKEADMADRPGAHTHTCNLLDEALSPAVEPTKPCEECGGRGTVLMPEARFDYQREPCPKCAPAKAETAKEKPCDEGCQDSPSGDGSPCRRPHLPAPAKAESTKPSIWQITQHPGEANQPCAAPAPDDAAGEPCAPDCDCGEQAEKEGM